MKEEGSDSHLRARIRAFFRLSGQEDSAGQTRKRPMPAWAPQVVFWFYHSVLVYFISVTISRDEAFFRFVWMTIVSIFIFYGVFGSKASNPFKNSKKSGYWLRLVIVLSVALFARYQTEFGAMQLFSVARNVPTPMRQFFFVFVPVFLIAGLALFIRFLDFRLEREAESLSTQLHETQKELDILKQQRQPHFLLQTIESIYSLVITQSPNSADYVLEFSNFLKYLLNGGNQPLVPANQEISAMKNLIRLHQLKSEEPLHIDFSLSGEMFLPGAQIIPILGIFMLENAFKHSGIMYQREAWIKVEIHCEEKMMSMGISSSSNENFSQSSTNSVAEHQKLRRELNSLHPGRFQLDYIKLPGSFQQTIQCLNI